MNISHNVDIVIIGAGAAGLTAALYASRRNFSTLVISEDIGGQTNMTPHIENYPGADPMGGPELMQKFFEQAKGFGAQFVFERAHTITKEKELFTIATTQNTYTAKAIILAFGLSHKPLGIENEDAFLGKGISYCATCDGPLFKNKKVAIVGETYAAIEAADYISTLAKELSVIVKTGALFQTNSLAKSLLKKKNVTVYKDSQIYALQGKKKLESITLKVAEDMVELPCDGLFVKLGFMPNTSWIKDMIQVDKKQHVVIDELGQTNIEGIFACGDVTQSIFKQIVIAAGEGAKAALTAAKYLSHKQATDIVVDWTTH